MAHDEDTFTPEEQAQAEAIDQQIDERLRALPFLPPDRRPASEPELIHELTRFYQPEAEEIQSRLQRARERVEQRRAQSLAQQRQKRTPLTRLRFLQERQEDMKNPLKHLRSSQRSSRLVALVAALLLVVVIGGLTTGIILVRSHGGTTANPTATATLAPGQTQKPTLAPTQTPSPAPTQTPGGVPGSGIVSIQMLDANIGWAVTAQNHILRTTDGANHWQDVTPTSIDPPLDSSNADLAYDFFSSSLAWVATYRSNTSAAGGTTKLFRTTNGGQSWIRMDMQACMAQITFVTSQDGWTFGCEGVALGSTSTTIYRTTDGGATWANVASAGPATDDQPGALPFNGDKTGLGARDASTAWVTGIQNGPSLFVWLYVTHNGGATWQQQTLPIPPTIAGQQYVMVVTYPPTFFDAQDGILPVQFEGAAASPDDIYVTHDGGATWQSTSLTTASSFDFINARQGWGLFGTVLSVTSDGGLHWHELSTGQALNDVSSVNFVSSEVGWAVAIPASGATTLLKTTDGGQTWTPVPFPG